MKVILRGYGTRMNTEERQVARATASDAVRTRGTSKVPYPPREIIAQSAPRGVFLSWSLPAGNSDDIRGWRVYKDNEATLFAELHDRGTRQHMIDTTAGSSPPPVNFFVSSVNALGKESAKIQVQAASIVEAGAPAMPGSPPGYTQGGAGGGNTNSGTGGHGRGLNQN